MYNHSAKSPSTISMVGEKKKLTPLSVTPLSPEPSPAVWSGPPALVSMNIFANPGRHQQVPPSGLRKVDCLT